MKQFIIAGMVMIGGWAHAGLYNQTFSGGSVPPGNVPTVFTGSFTADPNAGDTVLSMTITLNVAGGYSGDFYFSLTGTDGNTTTVLLNQPGTVTSGLNITLQDGATTITSSSDLSSGTYAPYAALSGLNGQTADGTWTISFANIAGPADTLNSWTLNIDAVPEPITYALTVFGVVVLAAGGIRYFKARNATST
jgi:hypothetical protein